MSTRFSSNNRRIMILVQEINAMTDEIMELMAEAEPEEKVPFHVQLARILLVNVNGLNNWRIKEFSRYSAMSPRNTVKNGRNGIFVSSCRGHYAALDIHSSIVSNLDLHSNEVNPHARHYNTRRFIFDDLEEIIEFLEEIEDKLMTFF